MDISKNNILQKSFSCSKVSTEQGYFLMKVAGTVSRDLANKRKIFSLENIRMQLNYI
jgi:hypothetical protein